MLGYYILHLSTVWIDWESNNQQQPFSVPLFILGKTWRTPPSCLVSLSTLLHCYSIEYIVWRNCSTHLQLLLFHDEERWRE